MSERIVKPVGVDLASGELVAIRRAFGPAFEALARDDSRLMAVTADLGGSVGLSDFAVRHPDRYVNCGVAEMSMVGISAGLALEGYVPVAATFGAFLGRTLDHLRQAVGHNKAKIVLVGSHGGVSNGKDGPSAHAIEDLAALRSLPHFAVEVVTDANQLSGALRAAVDHPKSVYLRLYREPTPLLHSEDDPYVIGQASIVRPGTDVTLIACGPHVAFSAAWADAWSDQVSVEVIESHSIEPLDVECIVRSAEKTGRVVTVEDHHVNGGLGSAVAEALSEHRPTPVQRVGLHEYARSGPYYELLNEVGLGEAAVADAMSRALA